MSVKQGVKAPSCPLKSSLTSLVQKTHLLITVPVKGKNSFTKNVKTSDIEQRLCHSINGLSSPWVAE